LLPWGKIIVIINSDTKKGTKGAKVLIDFLEKAIDADKSIIKQTRLYQIRTKTIREVKDFFQKLPKNFFGQKDLIIAVGGDGTFHHVLNCAKGIVDFSKVAFIAFPDGNANDWYRAVVKDKKTFYQSLLLKRIKKVDLLEITVTKSDYSRINLKHPEKQEEKYFAHSYFGLGLTSQAAIALKGKSGNIVRELLIVIREAFNCDLVTVYEGKNREKVKISSLTYNIHELMAKELKFAVEYDDGRFIKTILYDKRSLFKTLPSGLFGRIKGCTGIADEFELPYPVNIQIDGEIIELASGLILRLEVLPGILKVPCGEI